MSNSLSSSTDLSKRLESIVLDLPEPSTHLGLVDPTERKRELRQIGGISAGGRLLLRPGVFTFGSKKNGSGRLSDGSPDAPAFTLTVDEEMNITIRSAAHSGAAGEQALLVDGAPVSYARTIDDQVVDAGSAQFVVAIPRPMAARPRQQLESLHSPRSENFEVVPPWVGDCIPEVPVEDGLDSHGEIYVDLIGPGQQSEIDELVKARRKAHLLPDEVAHRAVVGPTLLSDRSPQHPLFGVCAIGLGDLPIVTNQLNKTQGGDEDNPTIGSVERRLVGVGYGVPLSVDPSLGPIIVVGPVWLRTGVIRQIVLSLAVSSSPYDLRVSQFPACRDFDFCRTLPHFSSATASRTLAVADSEASYPIVTTSGDEIEPDWVVLGTESLDGMDETSATVVTVRRYDELTIRVGSDGEIIGGLTPVGIARSLAEEIAVSLVGHELGQSNHDLSSEE